MTICIIRSFTILEATYTILGPAAPTHSTHNRYSCQSWVWSLAKHSKAYLGSSLSCFLPCGPMTQQKWWYWKFMWQTKYSRAITESTPKILEQGYSLFWQLFSIWNIIPVFLTGIVETECLTMKYQVTMKLKLFIIKNSVIWCIESLKSTMKSGILNLQWLCWEAATLAAVNKWCTLSYSQKPMDGDGSYTFHYYI